jgi:UDP-N-acetylmuramate dehydrogenase
VSHLEVAQRLRTRIRGEVRTDAPLAPYTTFRVGGPADILVEAESSDDLRAVAAERGDRDVAVVGKGSNLLVSDEGFRGIAIRLGRAFRDHEATGTVLTLGGSVPLPAAARLTARFGLAGFEFAAEIPGTFGGAVRMNGGAHGRSMADVLLDAAIVDLRTGAERVASNADLGYGYRHSAITADDVVVGGRVQLERGDPSQIAETIAGYLRWRREHQPGGRSAGSVFKNPPGDSAGRLIDEAGCKGMRVGGAEVSPVHANFIVTSPHATAADVWSLIERVRETVRERAGVALEPEVRVLGRFAPEVQR